MKDYTAWLNAWEAYHDAAGKIPLMLGAGVCVAVCLVLAVVVSRDKWMKRLALIMALTVSATFIFPTALSISSSPNGVSVPSKPVTFARQLEKQTGIEDLQCLTSDGNTANLDTEGFPDRDSYACRYATKDGTLHDGLKLVIDRNGHKAGLFDRDGNAVLTGREGAA